MISQGVELMIECGPGKVLAGLNKRIDASVPTLTAGTLEQLNQTMEEMSDVVER